jgi:hypothetical protein
MAYAQVQYRPLGLFKRFLWTPAFAWFFHAQIVLTENILATH